MVAQRAHTEVNVFTVWPWAKRQNRIVRYIHKHFDIVDEYVSDRVDMLKFYGIEGPSSGVGGARIFIVSTMADRMARETSKGRLFVNPHMFDAKTKLRKWGGKSGKLNSVHGSDTQDEAWMNIRETLLPYETLLGAFDEIPGEWMILRNFRGEDEGGGDVDMLVDDLESTIAALNCAAVDAYSTPEGQKTKYVVRVGDKLAVLDIRTVDDGYLDSRWSQDVLANRVKEGGLYRPDHQDWYWTLLYHALIHKGELGKYSEVLEDLQPGADHSRAALRDYMVAQEYEYVLPKDLLVTLFGIINGKVTDGIRGASTVPQQGLQDVWRKACGYEPYPGTLNIQYDRHFAQPKPKLSATMYAKGPKGEVPVPLHFWDATINGYPVVLSYGGNQQNQVEVLAKVHLRTKLELETGDHVEVVVV